MKKVFEIQRETLIQMGKQMYSQFEKMTQNETINFACNLTKKPLKDYKVAVRELLSNRHKKDVPTIINLPFATFGGFVYFIVEVGEYGVEVCTPDDFLLTTFAFEDIDSLDDKINLNEAIFNALLNKKLREIETECKKQNGLDKISGGFATASVVGEHLGSYLIQLNSGVSSDVESDTHEERFWLKTEEIIA